MPLPGALIVGAIKGDAKERLLSGRYEPVKGIWSAKPLTSEVDAVACGSFIHSEPPEISAQGTAVKTLEAALWAFNKAATFEEGCLLAVNLGDDSDTVGAVYGQLAGAYYGVEKIPTKLITGLSKVEIIENMARHLLDSASRRGVKD